MENISSYQNSQINNSIPDMQKRMSNQEFTALDTEKLKKDSVELANKAKENANENWLFRTMRNIGIKEPKKTLKSLLFSIVTIIGVAYLGNKLSTPADKLGNQIDDILTGDNIIGKCRNGIINLLNSGVEQLKKLPKPKFVSNIKDALKEPLKPVWNVFRGFEHGGPGVFSNTNVETLSVASDVKAKEMVETMANTLGGNKGKAHKILNEVPEIDLSRRMRKLFRKHKLSDEILQKISDSKTSGKGIFGDDTKKIVDTLKEMSQKDISDARLKKLSNKLKISDEILDEITQKNSLGDDTEQVVSFFKKFNKQLLKNARCKDNFDKVRFSDKLIEEIRIANNCGDDTKKLTETLIKLKEGGFGNGLKDITMDQGDLMSAWWPANFVNKVNKKITGNEVSSLKGNLGDSLLKYASVRGKLAKTLPAKFVQIVPPLVGDQVSNFVNDKSGFGVFLCANLIGNYNKIQDAPKEKKVTTAINDVASGSLNWMIAMPIAYNSIYSLASLSKVQGGGISALVRNFGKIFAVGLNNTGKTGFLSKVAGTAGGVGRFALAFFVILPFVGKKINELCAKIFGKPYDPAEAEKAKQAEEAKNQVIPELNITQGELLEKMQNHPDVMQKIQNDPELLAKVQQDPKFLLELLDGKKENEEPKENVNIFNGQPLSPANKNVLSRRNNIPSNTTNNATNGIPSNATNNIANNTIPNSSTNSIFKPKENKNNSANNSQIAPSYDPEKGFDNLTYIPSSEAAPVPESSLSAEQKTKYDAQMEKADRALKRAEKFI